MTPPDYTADLVEIKPGLVCYDNNLDVVVVGEAVPYGNPNEPTWYRTTYLDGSRGSMMDGSRLSTTFRNYRGHRFTAPEVIPAAED